MKAEDKAIEIVDTYLVDDAILTKKERIRNAKQAIAAAFRSAVEEAYEDAARIVETFAIKDAEQIAAAIRARKEGMDAYPLSSLPKSWEEAVRFHGCGTHRDAVIVHLDSWKGHSGKGWYVYCSEYPEEGMTFLGKTIPKKDKRKKI